MKFGCKGFLAALVGVSLALSGCGLELLGPITKIATGQRKPLDAAPSWPMGLRLSLGSAELSLSDPRISKQLGGDLLKFEANGSMAIAPEPKSIDPIAFGDKLSLSSGITQDVPAQRLPAIEVKGIGFGSVSFPYSSTGLPTGISFQVPAAITTPASTQSLPLSDFDSATLSATEPGRITFRLENSYGVDVEPDIDLLQSNGTTVVGSLPDKTRVNRGQSANLAINLLAGAVLTNPLIVRISLNVPVQADSDPSQANSTLALSNLQPDSIKASSVTSKVAAQNLPAVTQVLDIAGKLPADQGIQRLDEVSVGTGSISLRITNKFPLAQEFQLTLAGIKDDAGNDIVQTIPVPADTLSFVRDISLVGRRIVPDASGSITAQLTGSTVDTGSTKVTLESTDEATASIVVSPLEFSSVVAAVDRIVNLPTSSTPVSLPKQLIDSKIGLAKVSLALEITNRSQIQGTITPDIKAVINGAPTPLVFNGTGTFAPADAPGQTKTTVIEINESNSNLIQLLNSGPSELIVGGQVRIQSNQLRLSAGDQVSGKVAVSIPLSLTVPSTLRYDVTPATSLNLDAKIREQLGSNLKELALRFKVENGWGLPLNINLLLSKQDDPFSDPEARQKTFSTGTGALEESAIVLQGDDVSFFKDAKKVGIRVTSPGTSQPVTLKSTDKVRVQAAAEIKLRVSPKSLNELRK